MWGYGEWGRPAGPLPGPVVGGGGLAGWAVWPSGGGGGLLSFIFFVFCFSVLSFVFSFFYLFSVLFYFSYIIVYSFYKK